ncbi:SRPBCC domain-containing protein [Aminobacter sp. HY435]|uniref:SRPBCC domain-containing protein n=1 Tax=Aminobacter sp. HY435 TaxID=2970917 RepID=UPI0022B982FE|nr:SRPBCC domain-containing protein [Aminobacter sp. HY435]
MKHRLEVTTPSDREIAMTRVFDAPRDLVFDCWPDGWSFAVCEVNLSVGGTYRFVWRHEDGRDMGMTGTYRAILRPERIVSVEIFDMDWTDGEARSTLVLTERDGRTISVNTMLYSSKEARDGAIAIGMARGVGAGYDRLDGVLAEQVAAQ